MSGKNAAIRTKNTPQCDGFNLHLADELALQARFDSGLAMMVRHRQKARQCGGLVALAAAF